MIQFAYLSFDSAFVEIWATLLNGATLIIPGSRIRDNLYGTLGDIAKDYPNLILTLPPSVAENLDDDTLDSIKTLVLAGEELPRHSPHHYLLAIAYRANAEFAADRHDRVRSALATPCVRARRTHRGSLVTKSTLNHRKPR